MATFTAAKETEIFFNGYDLTSYFNSASVPKAAEAAETTTFGNDAKTFLGALKDGSVTLAGFLDESTAGGAGTVLDAALGTDSNEISVYSEGDTIGKFGQGLLATETSKEISAPVAGVVELSAEAVSNHAAERIVSLHALGNETADGTATATVDHGGSTLAGASGYLHVTSLVGGTLTVKVQDSVDDNTYADLLTFTTTSATTFSERQYVSGQVDRYLRSVWTLNGGTAAFVVGAGRNPHP